MCDEVSDFYGSKERQTEAETISQVAANPMTFRQESAFIKKSRKERIIKILRTIRCLTWIVEKKSLVEQNGKVR